MVTIHHDDGDVSILVGPDDATFEVATWCSDTEGQNPAQVHLIIQPTTEIKLLYRFTGPVAINRLIDALLLHRNDVWPEESHRDGRRG